ncbi:MAG: hypothetical protein N3B21_08700 [Clostridia bacterium]|nr:hypothetical protein [Clostridia bacterium]
MEIEQRVPLFAPLVHSRTYKMDFRPKFLAVPEDFNDSRIAWAKEFVLSTTNSADFLEDSIRKSVFSDGKYCVIGITCMAKTLNKIGREKVAEGKEYDEHSSKPGTPGRPIYVFLGYVFQIDREKKIAYDIPIEMFADLFKDYVSPRWEEKWSDPGANMATLGRYQPIDNARCVISSSDENGEREFNHEIGDEVHVFPSGKGQEELLWENALAIVAKGMPFSLCIGMHSSNDARRSVFNNISAHDAKEKFVVKRSRFQETKSVDVTRESQQSLDSRQNPKTAKAMLTGESHDKFKHERHVPNTSEETDNYEGNILDVIGRKVEEGVDRVLEKGADVINKVFKSVEDIASHENLQEQRRQNKCKRCGKTICNSRVLEQEPPKVENKEEIMLPGNSYKNMVRDINKNDKKEDDDIFSI